MHFDISSKNDVHHLISNMFAFFAQMFELALPECFVSDFRFIGVSCYFRFRNNIYSFYHLLGYGSQIFSWGFRCYFFVLHEPTQQSCWRSEYVHFSENKNVNNK